MIKTLTLSIDEIRQLIEIADPKHRQQVLQSLTDNAATPPTEIAAEDYAETHPMALRLAEKIRRKAEAAERRRLKRQNRQEQPHQSNEETWEEKRPVEKIEIYLDEPTVDRLLWLKKNHKLWRKAINCITESIIGSSIPRQLRVQIQSLLRRLFDYIDPLIRKVNKYYDIPKQFRPRFASI